MKLNGRTTRADRRPQAAVALLVCAAFLTVVADSWGSSNFGTRSMNPNDVGKKEGSIVSILVPSLSQFVASGEFVLQRTVVQSDFSGTAGLVQAGIYRSASNAQLDNCGSRANYTVYTEHKSAGTANTVTNYHCQLFGQATSGNEPTFAVFHSSVGWRTQKNGVELSVPVGLGFSSGSPAIGAEIAEVSGTTANSKPDVRYGYKHTWQYYDKNGQQGAVEPTVNANTFTYSPEDSNWTVPPVPTPFRITHS